jgi:hypothetical protein
MINPYVAFFGTWMRKIATNRVFGRQLHLMSSPCFATHSTDTQ